MIVPDVPTTDRLAHEPPLREEYAEISLASLAWLGDNWGWTMGRRFGSGPKIINNNTINHNFKSTSDHVGLDSTPSAHRTSQQREGLLICGWYDRMKYLVSKPNLQ